MASPGRFELPAPRLGGVCSIQLSYGDIFDFSWSRMERSASQDFDDLIIRRRTLYPAELLGCMGNGTWNRSPPARRRAVCRDPQAADARSAELWRHNSAILAQRRAGVNGRRVAPDVAGARVRPGGGARPGRRRICARCVLPVLCICRSGEVPEILRRATVFDPKAAFRRTVLQERPAPLDNIHRFCGIIMLPFCGCGHGAGFDRASSQIHKEVGNDELS